MCIFTYLIGHNSNESHEIMKGYAFLICKGDNKMNKENELKKRNYPSERAKPKIRQAPTEKQLARLFNQALLTTDEIMIICDFDRDKAKEIKEEIQNMEEYFFTNSKGKEVSRLPKNKVPTEMVLRYSPYSKNYIDRVRKLEV